MPCGAFAQSRAQPGSNPPSHIHNTLWSTNRPAMGNTQDEAGSASGDPGNPFPKWKYLKLALDKNPLCPCPRMAMKLSILPSPLAPPSGPGGKRCKGQENHLGDGLGKS